MPGNGKIFISHAHADNDRCQSLVSALSVWSADYWFDAEQLEAGSGLSDGIQQAISERDIFLRVCTPALQQSYWCKLEQSAFRGLIARDHQQKRDTRVLINLIMRPGYEPEPFDYASVYIDASQRPPEEWLPELRRALEHNNAVALTGGAYLPAPGHAPMSAPVVPVQPAAYMPASTQGAMYTPSMPIATATYTPSFPSTAPTAPAPGSPSLDVTPAAPAKVNGLATAALICGILGLCTGLASIGAIILGHIALVQIKKSDGQLTGRGLAIAGLVMGYVWVALEIAVAIFYVTHAGTSTPTSLR